MRLTREVRFSLTREAPGGGITNSWGGWPACDTLAPYVLLRATVSGVVDSRTGYLCNISLIDRAVREQVIPLLREHWLTAAEAPPTCLRLLRLAAPVLAEALPSSVTLVALELRPTPYLAHALSLEGLSMITVTQSFEFAAAHRLFCPQMSEAENREIFGKCTNSNGHGHNYVVEVTVSGEPDERSGVVIDVGRLERTVKERVIDVFDHRHLNDDCAEFADLVPSVENITRVIWDKLEGQFEPAQLASVRVYETPKTYAELRR
jgi:6-pyruvoyltetrahydropterin/6-carboxytetrahydropterin synthase